MSNKEEFPDDEIDQLFKGEVHHVSVSKLADQFWCEMQLHLRLEHGIIPTEEMIEGSNIHRSLEEELGPVIEVEVSTLEDSIITYLLQIYTKLQTLLILNVTRELPVIGKISQIPCLGIIDQLEIITTSDGEKKLVISDYKTRKSKRAPSYEQKRRNRVQLQVYWYLLNKMRNGDFNEEMFREYFNMPENISPSEELLAQLPVEHKEILEKFPADKLLSEVFELLHNLPEQSYELRAIYLHQEDRQEVCKDNSLFHQESFEVDMEWAIGYWKGERTPNSCSQQWMCNFCQFTDNCSFFLRRYLNEDKK
ncbi:MAG TPA: PD-(D/E)XK nuclease family protein [candidate division Zixibacteria bacterium]|nr:PD-(D/E)XK nuclease family protein [candidate division Zixibacteria bacterium]